MDVAELRRTFLFEELSDEQLGELVAVGEEVAFSPGDVLFREAEPSVLWWVLLEGRLELSRRTGRDEPVLAVMEQPGQWAGGFHAWTDAAGYLATGRAVTAGRMLRISAEDLQRLAEQWSPFGIHLIRGFFQTVRNVDALARQRAGLVALGTLAAGLAHELNNPAAAASRAAGALRESCDDLQSSLVKLAQGALSAEQFMAIDGLRREIAGPAAAIDAVTASGREDELVDWLEAKEVDDAWRIAPTLAAAGADTDWCDRVATALDAATLGPGLEWVASTLTTSTLLSEVGESTRRVSELVAAVRSYSQLDRASVQLIDVTEGLESTLAVLHHKLGDVTVVRDYAPDLPLIEAKPGELNQVWTNLIDNAVHAMGGQGTLRLATRVDGGQLVVEVGDEGVGMPPEVQDRAFDPFFTTKPVGEGTGLGLDISHRIVTDGHGGEMEIRSQPGDTVMSVRLPLRE